MTPAPTRPAVVVAIDDAGSSGDAVDWASAEAAARGWPLRLVHAFHPPLPADPYGLVPPVDCLFTVRTAAESILREAVVRARSVASDVEMSALLLLGTPARALIDEARRAHLLVMGSRGLCGVRGLLARSVSVHVVAHASCPVVVVQASKAGEQGWSPPRVVVGVDATPSCTPAVRFAFEAARQRGVPLAAVHAWSADPAGDTGTAPGPQAVARMLGHRTLMCALDRGRDEFPDVPVITSLVRGDPADALVAASRGAALVVVGSRGRRHLMGTMLGSVSQSVLHHGHSPLAIIGPDSAAVPRRCAPRRRRRPA